MCESYFDRKAESCEKPRSFQFGTNKRRYTFRKSNHRWYQLCSLYHRRGKITFSHVTPCHNIFSLSRTPSRCFFQYAENYPYLPYFVIPSTFNSVRKSPENALSCGCPCLERGTYVASRRRCNARVPRSSRSAESSELTGDSGVETPGV